MTHVFIVDDQTFRYHLEYMFAGTCASWDSLFIEDVNYNNPRKKEQGLTPGQERTIAKMIADVSRIRIGDKILFYVKQSKYHEGMFFGVFRVCDNPFFDSNGNNYLSQELGINLNFRVLIEPDRVFQFGVSEREALDNLEGITHPSQMCWSMIYRKLKAKRGCTMITDQESDRLIRLLCQQNNNVELNGAGYSFNCIENHIELKNESPLYEGTKTSIDIKDRMLVLSSREKAFETHLQAFILQNCDRNPQLIELIALSPDEPLWIGNEVYCGFGMQSIDVLLIGESDDNVTIKIIELKDEIPRKQIIKDQIPWYIKWVDQYVAPNYSKRVIIKPIIIAANFQRMSKTQTDFYDEMMNFNSNLPVNNNSEMAELEYINFKIDRENQSISFHKNDISV